MEIVEYVLGGILFVLAVALVVCVLLQSGKDKKLSGAIAGGSDTFFGKSKAKTKDRKLFIATTAMSIAFTVIVLALYCVVCYQG